MVTALDEAVGSLVEALKRRGLYSNTIIVFASDVRESPPDHRECSYVPTYIGPLIQKCCAYMQNGADPTLGGNNFPLRGRKGTWFEGGNRVPAFVHLPMARGSARGLIQRR